MDVQMAIRTKFPTSSCLDQLIFHNQLFLPPPLVDNLRVWGLDVNTISWDGFKSHFNLNRTQEPSRSEAQDEAWRRAAVCPVGIIITFPSRVHLELPNVLSCLHWSIENRCNDCYCWLWFLLDTFKCWIHKKLSLCELFVFFRIQKQTI